MSYKVGDKVLIEGEVFKIEKDNIPYPYGIRIAKGVEFMFGEEEMISKTYSDGLADAWELARKMTSWTYSDRKKVLEFGYSLDAFMQYTYQEALAKIEAYESSKAIKVGDVVKVDGTNKDCGIVIAIDEIQKKARLMYADTSFRVNEWYLADLKKTGRHIDIEHLLEQIRGDS